MLSSHTKTDAISIDVDPGILLSYQQQRSWQAIKAQGANAFLVQVPTAQCGLRIEGILDITCLQNALQRVVDRHEILRTQFTCANETEDPVQHSVPLGSFLWRCLDLTDCGEEERAERIRNHRTEDCLTPFSLTNCPLLRASLLRFAPNEHILLLTVPSICADADSMHTIASEALGWYTSPQQSPPNGEVLQYSSVSEWQRSLHEEEDAVEGRKYWSTQPVSSAITFPLQQPPHTEVSFSPSSHTVSISDRVQSFLRTTEREDIFLLGCWLTLLRLASGQAEVGVGVTFHGRSYKELERVVGPMARVIPVTCTVREDMRFAELLQAVAGTVDLAEDWQEFYERKAGERQHETISFELNCWPRMDLAGSGLRITLAFEQAWTEPFHLKLALTRNGDDLQARLDFDQVVFESPYVASLCEQLTTLIEGAAEHLAWSIEELPLLSEKERNFLLKTCNDTVTIYPQDGLLHHLIAKQAFRTPHRVAIRLENDHLTFAELDRRANQLAHRLRQMHIGPEIRVAIHMHRSLEMMISILAVLKAGGAYVPLDPSYPAERLSFMLQDAEVAVILTETRLHATLPQTDAEILCVDGEMKLVSAEQATYEPMIESCSENLAYVLYTSGSTGLPKGAMISHRNLLNYLVWCCEAYAMESGAGTPVHSSIGFDATITAFFPALLAGRTVTLLRESEGIETLSTELGQGETFSLIKITPAHLSLLNETLAENQLATKTNVLVIGGDALPASRLAVWRQHAPQTRLINEYGPTETVVGCCVHESADDDFTFEAVPIGRPIANTRLYVLDHRLNPLPVGIPGELFIAGDGVCRGYLGRPATTAERFLPDGFADGEGERMYRTGDLVVQRPDGVLRFLGRLDHQVKIRSYRIEPGEIEAQLELHPVVSQSVVVACNSATGEKSLAAYVECSSPAPLSSEELRAFLLEKLPEFMVPSTFVILDKLPLTAHGKVDRNALPDPASVRTTQIQQQVAPRTDVEKKLMSIWQEVLKQNCLGIYDDFFRSGGDSIQSILVAVRAAKVGLRLTPRDVFRNPTIAGLASIVESSGSIVVPACQAQGAVPLTPIQHWFFEQNLPNPNHFNQSVMLAVPANLRTDWVELVLEALAAHHEALRLRFTREADGWLQNYSVISGSFVVEAIDLNTLPKPTRQEAIDAAIKRTQSALNIMSGPMMRAVLFRDGHERSGQLLLTVHHLVIDGVSWRILLDDFATAYEQLTSNQAIRLSPSTDTFKTWSTRLQDYASTNSASAEAEYWLRRPAAVGGIPLDFPVGPDRNTAATAANIQVALGSQKTFALLHGISDVYHTDVDDLLLTALAQTLACWNGSHNNLIDCEGHGREDLFPDVDISRTVGWFTSIYPLYLDLTGVTGLGEQLKAVKEQRRRVPRKGIGYGVLRYLSRNSELRDRLAAQPYPEISFNYLGGIDNATSTPILSVSYVMVGDEQNSTNPRPYPLDVIAYVQNSTLQVQIVYSTALHKAATIERLGHTMIGYIESLVDHCLSPSAGGLTPSDFPDIELSQTELDELEAGLE